MGATYWDTNTATVWDVTVDQYGRPSMGSPYTIAATWVDTGDTQTDEDGNQFVPQSTFYTMVAVPRGSYIAKGDQTAAGTDPLSVQAQKIKKVTQFDISQFGDPPEYEVFT